MKETYSRDDVPAKPNRKLDRIVVAYIYKARHVFLLMPLTSPAVVHDYVVDGAWRLQGIFNIKCTNIYMEIL